MVAKFTGLLFLLFIVAGLAYVAIVDVNIPQQEKIIAVDVEKAANQGESNN